MHFCVCTGDDHWISQKLSMEKSTVGNESYNREVTVSGGFFVLHSNFLLKQRGI